MEDCFFELERGDPRNLEGKVLIYSKVLEPQYKNSIFSSIYVGRNIFDIFEPKYHDVIRNMFEEESNLNSQGLNLEADKIGDFAIRPLSFDSREELVVYKGDIIFTGDFLDFESAELVMQPIAFAYMGKFNSQKTIRERNLRLINNRDCLEDFENYGPQELQTKLYQLTGEFIHGIEFNDELRKKNIKNILFDFAEKFNCKKHIENLINFANLGNLERQLLVKMQIDLIAAIRSENYETAARLRDEIKSIYSS